ncbi:Xaa-Pro dipeptidyl-peptidase [Rhodopirellula sp. MGV]|uniref:Xaa-Pro dipeptidyl-peptidase n=1 Tax=Rhodopirellula sp. MGV TaxID=2023130 RepID=UPI000B96C380|nr:Xaa-Pro dipeptidyl-peptidase [Rhodopirellula sp. MGV]OYP33088.1 Xaa-Pro dipeptidyl-peptidase [Rhodopirellula sp. MGV]PNY37959.1 Xaa-Pro dipeptidyl-peptidase [Rhodopirellula baltica]
MNRLASPLIAFLIFVHSPLWGAEVKIPVIKDGEAQVIKELEDSDYWIRHDLWVETEFDTDGDGKLDRMHVAVTRPRQTDTQSLKLPVVYNSSPYFAGTTGNDDYFWDVRQELGDPPPNRSAAPDIEREGTRPIISKRHISDWLPRGYVVVHSSAPGTGLSQGCPTVGGDPEALAPKAVIDWLCGRGKGFTEPVGGEPVEAYWCSGKVGMTGTSYNGTIPLAAATTGVEGLEVIIPVAPNTSYYHYYRSNGLVRHPGGYLGEDIDILYDFIHSGGDEAIQEYCDCNVRDELMHGNQDRATGDYNDFWYTRDYLNRIDGVKAAVLMAHAFNDWNVVPEHSIRIYQALQKNGIETQLFMHQGGHGGPPPIDMMNRWFTHYLFDVDNGVPNGSKAWIVRENDDRGKPTEYADYPNPDAEDVVVYPVAGAPQQGKLQTTPIDQPSTETLVDNFSFSGDALAQAEFTEHRLIYTTPKLAKDTHLSGAPRIKLRLACDRPAANLSVWLVSLPWNTDRRAKITDNIITRGWADPQNIKSIRESEPLVPGQYYDMEFDLQPDDQVIAKGQQIGLMIMSSDRDFTLHPTPGTELTIDLQQTQLSLPIVGGELEFEPEN